jgi:TonB family protein
VYRLGNGVEPPRVLRDARPAYTSEALMRRIEGTVILEVVVGADGVPGAIHVTRSLDPGGLDDEAVKAAQNWRFVPGRFNGSPVAVLVTLILDFHIR